MSLMDITSPGAVTRSLQEAQSLGREAFLSKYGFGKAGTHFVLWKGQHFDSKAILGAAHAFQHGNPLTPSDFSGGEGTVATMLRALGFAVTQHSDWVYDEGDITLRKTVAARYGGSTQGGIQPSAATPNIFLYSDPEAGRANGYDFDKWDDTNPNLFHYTGEGRNGNQTLTRGNGAVLHHADEDRTLRLFHTLDNFKRAGGKRQEYLGAFYLNPGDPYRWETAPGEDGRPRRVVVFHLLKDSAAPTPGQNPNSAKLASPLTPKSPATGADASAPTTSTAATDTPALGPDTTKGTDVTIVDTEQHTE